MLGGGTDTHRQGVQKFPAVVVGRWVGETCRFSYSLFVFLQFSCTMSVFDHVTHTVTHTNPPCPNPDHHPLTVVVVARGEWETWQHGWQRHGHGHVLLVPFSYKIYNCKRGKIFRGIKKICTNSYGGHHLAKPTRGGCPVGKIRQEGAKMDRLVPKTVTI